MASAPAGFAGIPRVRLTLAPTPLHRASRLSEELGLDIWFKRDDLLGLGLGGNKARPLEFLLGQAVAEGCDVLVTGSGPQSNWSMLAAMAARMHGLEAVICFYGDPPPRAEGNLLLQEMTGAHVRWTGSNARESADQMVDEVAAQLRAQGRHPYAIPRGGATPRGSLGYLLAAEEIGRQCDEVGIAGATVWLAAGSCGTQAGLVAGAAAGMLGPERAASTSAMSSPVVGVAVSRPASECRRRILDLSIGAAALTGTEAPSEGAIRVLDGYLGPSHGKASPEGVAAAELTRRMEGVFLDPPYCAKAMAALVDAARNADIAGPVVFLVSGGAPTLFVRDGAL